MKKNKKLEFWLVSLFIISLVILVIRQFVLYSTPEFFWFGQEVGEILFNLAIGYIITSLFYYLTIYRREYKNRKHAYEFTRSRLDKIIGNVTSLIESIYNDKKEVFDATGIDIETEEGLNNALRLLDMHAYSPRYNSSFQQLKWHELFSMSGPYNKNMLQEILVLLPYLDPEDIQRVTDLLSHEYLELLRNMDLSLYDEISFINVPMHDFKSKIIDFKKDIS